MHLVLSASSPANLERWSELCLGKVRVDCDRCGTGEWQAGLEALEVVNVSMCPKLTDAGLEVLAANMPPRLRHVTVAGCEYVTKQGAAELQGALPAHPGGALQRLVEFNHQSPTLKELLLR